MALTTTIEQATSEPVAETPAEQRRARLESELQHFVTIVTEQMHPECIILFGSLANGRVHEWSDLDLAVIAKTELPFLDRLEQIFLHVDPHGGLDVLVYTPEEWSHLKATRLFVQQEIVEKGRVLYERTS
jgi:predicted nucleotidyltransferase